jgi:glycosyltransferase involved in cell wall biosynthesis
LITPLVSVCIPTYNRPAGLRKTLESVCGQSYPHLEIIVSDNASTVAETREVLEEFKRRDSRISVLYQEVNLGPSLNFELARAHTHGVYYMWCADDDYLSSNYVESCVRYLETMPSLTLAAGTPCFVDGKDHFERQAPKALMSRWFWVRITAYLLWVQNNYIFYGLYRRQDIGSFPILNQLGGDWSFVARQLLCGGAVVSNDCEIYCKKTLSSTSSSKSSLQKVLGLPPWTAKFPRVATTMTVLRDVISVRRCLNGPSFLDDSVYFSVLLLIMIIRWPTEFLARKLHGMK